VQYSENKVEEVKQDRIELSSFLIYSINTFTIATGNSTLTMTLTQLDLMLLTDKLQLTDSNKLTDSLSTDSDNVC